MYPNLTQRGQNSDFSSFEIDSVMPTQEKSKPSIQTFSSHSLYLARKFVSSPNARQVKWAGSRKAWVLGWSLQYIQVQNLGSNLVGACLHWKILIYFQDKTGP